MVQARADHFAGRVWLDSDAVATDANELKATLVLFEPGSRTHWHRHPGGQVLYILSGEGLVVTRRGDPPLRVGAGDVVEIPADADHWHGANEHQFMAHVAITNRRADEWGEPVTH